MKVQAIDNGYYHEQRLRKGDIFELKPVQGFKVERDEKGKVIKKEPHLFSPEEQFSDKWMRKVKAGQAPLPEGDDELNLPGVKLKKQGKKKTLSDVGDSVI
jgi:hypothetical protein